MSENSGDDKPRGLLVALPRPAATEPVDEPAQIRAELIELLEQMLEAAKSGTILDALVLTSNEEGYGVHWTPAYKSIEARLGAMECMKHLYLMEINTPIWHEGEQ